MSTPYGPVALTAANISQQRIPQSSAQVRVKNDSPFDLAVSLAATRPTLVTVLSGGDWHDVIPAWHSATLTVPRPSGSTAPGGVTFSGNVWLLPIDSSAKIAYNGTVTGLRQAWLTAYEPGEAVSVDGAPREQSLISQARVIAVPLTPFKCWSVYQQSFAVIGATAQPFPGDITVMTSPGVPASVIAYLHFLYAYSASDGIAHYALELVETTLDGSTVVATTDIYHFSVARSAASVTYAKEAFAPAVPFSVRVATHPTTAFIFAQLKLEGATAVPQSLTYSLGMDSDKINQAQVPGIGGGENSANPDFWGQTANPTIF